MTVVSPRSSYLCTRINLWVIRNGADNTYFENETIIRIGHVNNLVLVVYVVCSVIEWPLPVGWTSSIVWIF